MREIFIATKNLALPDYLMILINQIHTDHFARRAKAAGADLMIVDTESLLPSEVKSSDSVPVILFCYEEKPLLLQYTFSLDVNGVFCLSTSAQELKKTIDAALAGDIHYNENMISLLFSNSVNKTLERVNQLTEREKEIIQLMKQDLTNEEIADQLRLSVRTINAHKGNIMRKIGTRSSTGLFQLLTEYDPSFKK